MAELLADFIIHKQWADVIIVSDGENCQFPLCQTRIIPSSGPVPPRTLAESPCPDQRLRQLAASRTSARRRKIRRIPEEIQCAPLELHEPNPSGHDVRRSAGEAALGHPGSPVQPGQLPLCRL